MKIAFDTVDRTVLVSENGHERRIDLDSPEGFSVLSRLWVTTGWSQRYTYGFEWMGRPIIQLPADLMTIQEVLYRVKPTLLIETGVAHGGSLVFYASLFKAMGVGRVIGIDIEIRPHNRTAIEEHDLNEMITLIEGSSVESETLKQLQSLVRPQDRVMVVLDSNHSKDHVLAELDAYAPLVSPDSYIVATDGVMEWLTEVPGVPKTWLLDNPKRAVEEWLPKHAEFALEEPPEIQFNEGSITERITHWPSAYLRRSP